MAQFIAEMTHQLTLIAPPGRARLTDALIADVRQRAKDAGIELASPQWLCRGDACDLPMDADAARRAARWATTALVDYEIDFGVTASANRRKQFFIADMDATIVIGETLDELAVYGGVGEQVAAVTARAMRGELDFKEALRARVATLAELDAAIIDTVIAKVELTPGAGTLLATLAANGVTTMLVSGGFGPFVEHVAKRLRFDRWQANTLAIDGGRLTGKVVEPILDKEAKLAALGKLASDLDLTPADGLAVGDGANDLAMIEAAGLGVAWHGKPILRAGADLCVDHGDLTALLYYQGYQHDEFVIA